MDAGKTFEENNDNKKNDMIKKIGLAAVAVITLTFIIISNFGGKKKASVETVKSIETVQTIDEYEKELQKPDTEEEGWKKDSSSGLIQTVPVVPQNISIPSGNSQNSGQSRPSVRNITNDDYSDGSYQRVSTPYAYTPSNEMKKRLDPSYQAIVAHFSKTKENAWFDESYEEKIRSSNDNFAQVEEPLKNLYDGADRKVTFSTNLPAGTRIIAVTDQDISSDHPGTFTATVVRPFEIKGSKLICESSGNRNDRIDVSVLKIIGQNEASIEGQAQMGYPGLTGRVTNHWVKRMGPAIMNAAIGGGFLAWSLSGPQTGRVDTRDVVVSEVVSQSVSGVQNEITRLGGDYPNTVVVKQGTQFEILLTKEVVL